jgi:uncharacterized protein (TIGR03086 family)
MTVPVEGTDMLKRAVDYALGSLAVVTPDRLSCSTPCPAWDLRALLYHLNDSLAALHQGLNTGHIGSFPVVPDAGGDAHGLITTLLTRASQLVGCRADSSQSRAIAIGDRSLEIQAVSFVGAIEVATHGWDIARACRRHRPIPPALAADLLAVAPLVVTNVIRPAQFALPIAASPLADPSDRLIAFLGRDPAA